MLIKNKKNDFVPTNDYEKAKKEFLDFYGEMSARLHSWKLISFFMLITVIISVSGVVYLSTRSSLIPYVIEVDETGNAKGINPAYQVTYNPSEANIEYFLQKSIIFLTREMKEKYNQIVKNENWTDMIKNGFSRDVQIESVNKVAGTEDSYQVRWTENLYKRGAFFDSKKVLAIFSIATEQPKNLEELQTNPLGIKITDFHMTNEK